MPLRPARFPHGIPEGFGRGELADPVRVKRPRLPCPPHRRRVWAIRNQVARLGQSEPRERGINPIQLNAEMHAFQRKRKCRFGFQCIEPLAPPVASMPAVSSNPVPVGTPQPENLDTRAAAALLGVSTDTLERLRTRPEGPPFKPIGRRVLYPIDGLRECGRRK